MNQAINKKLAALCQELKEADGNPWSSRPQTPEMKEMSEFFKRVATAGRMVVSDAPKFIATLKKNAKNNNSTAQQDADFLEALYALFKKYQLYTD